MTSTADLRVELPDTWELLDPRDVGEIERAFAGNPELIRKVGGPDLVARLYQPMVNEDGELAYVVMASLAVEYFELTSIPPAAEWADEGQTYSVDVAPGLTVEFFSLRIPIFDAELDLAAVATFTTPNLPLIGEMEPGFRAIADSIRFERT
jgi:hypothetical protein